MTETIFMIIWYIIGILGVYVIMRREQDYEIIESTIEDILSLLVFGMFGIMVWLLYGAYLLCISNILSTKVFKKRKLTKHQKEIIKNVRRTKFRIEVPLGIGKTNIKF